MRARNGGVEGNLVDFAALRLILVLDDGDLVLERGGVLGGDFEVEGKVVRDVGLVDEVDERSDEARDAQDLRRGEGGEKGGRAVRANIAYALAAAF
jgi:hypothetical protein